ncbi:hypothetical protein EVAR_101537_1 [Eumeta japonica]|uniref:Uncharacterized protein n=1 Tax=Eumeta variegata TaxID=151549 RepID=A0A4C1TBU9_EUMVA|nr:hypothetical protein EVAR_101537_1 [Eumeta japonica]
MGNQEGATKIELNNASHSEHSQLTNTWNRGREEINMEHVQRTQRLSVIAVGQISTIRTQGAHNGPILA